MSDNDYNKVRLLLPCDGANNGTTADDYSRIRKSITFSGNAKTVTATKKYGTASLALDGAGDLVSVGEHSDLTIATADFCIEFWVNPTSGGAGSAYGRIIQFGPNATAGGLWIARNNASNPLTLLVQGYTSSYINLLSPSATSIANGSFTHVALCRENGTFRVYQAGVQVAVNTPTTYSIISNAIYIGGNSVAGESFNGYLDGIRITVGDCRYPSGTVFTPPEAAFVKTLSGTVKDGTNANAVRTVTAIPRISNPRGFSTTSAGDGTWSLLVPDIEHTVICLDDTAGTTYNDLIHRATPV